MTKIWAISAASVILVVLGFTAGFEFFVRTSSNNCVEGQIAGGSIGGPFELVDGNGRTVTDKDIIVKPSLVYFGYTFCPDVCPFDVARNVAAVDILKEQGIEVAPIFVTIDPGRDTFDVVNEYAEAYHPDMIGLTGTPEQVKEAADAYRVYFNKHDSDNNDYLVDHSTFTYLMFPENEFADYFRRSTSAEDMAERVSCFVEA